MHCIALQTCTLPFPGLPFENSSVHYIKSMIQIQFINLPFFPVALRMRKMGRLLIGSWIFLLWSRSLWWDWIGSRHYWISIAAMEITAQTTSTFYESILSLSEKSKEEREEKVQALLHSRLGWDRLICPTLSPFFYNQWTPKNGYHWRKYMICYIVGCFVQYHLHWVLYNQEPPKLVYYYVTRPVVSPPLSDSYCLHPLTIRVHKIMEGEKVQGTFLPHIV